MKVDLVISVVLYNNTRDQVEKILLSIKNTTVKVILQFIDNTPGGTPFFETLKLPENVLYLLLPNNIGYGAAHNKAILNTDFDAPYHLIMNPDIYFESYVLEKLKAYMDDNTDVGLVMPKIVWPTGADQGLRKLLPSPFQLIFRRFIPSSLKQLSKKAAENYELQNLDAENPMDVPVLSGCFMFCRRSVLQQIGGFDERFFLYLEDVDLSRRLSEQAINRYWPGVQVVHEYQKDSYKSGTHLKKHLTSALKYFNKHGWIFDPYRRDQNKKALNQKQILHTKS